MIRCVLARSLLTTAELAGQEPRWPAGYHRARCIKCQAHVASLRATRRRLSEMRQDRFEVPAGIWTQVLNGLDGAESRPVVVTSGRWLRAAGASMAAALLAAVWVRHRALARA